VGIDWDGRRQILGVELASRESRSSWKASLVGLKARGLGGVELVVSDDHPGLTAAIREVLPEAAWQRCYVGLLKNPGNERGVAVWWGCGGVLKCRRSAAVRGPEGA
jgi:putative transposase